MQYAIASAFRSTLRYLPLIESLTRDDCYFRAAGYHNKRYNALYIDDKEGRREFEIYHANIHKFEFSFVRIGDRYKILYRIQIESPTRVYVNLYPDCEQYSP